MTLSIELLPAPLGPMIDEISPRLTPKPTPVIALTPPKLRWMSSTRRTASVARRRPALSPQHLAPLAHLAQREDRLVARVVDVGAEHVALRALPDGLARAGAGAHAHGAEAVLDVRVLAAGGEAVPDLRLDDAIGVDDEEVPALARRLQPAIGLVVERVDLGLGRERHARRSPPPSPRCRRAG